MPKEKEEKTAKPASNEGPGAAVAKPVRKRRPRRKPPQPLPPWKVLLHNDDKNEFPFVIKTIVELTPLNEQDATQRTHEANDSGVALLLTTHKERAELYQEQFQSKGLLVTIEAAN